MTQQEYAVRTNAIIGVVICVVFLSIMVWFVSIVHSNTERERMKHETCTVTTTTTNTGTVTVAEYCGK